MSARDIIIIAIVGFVILIYVFQRILIYRQRIFHSKLTVKSDLEDGIFMFTTPSCRVCNTMKSSYKDLIDSGKIKILDIKDKPNLFKKFNIMAVPTVFFIKNGEVEKSFYGFVDRKEFKNIS